MSSKTQAGPEQSRRDRILAAVLATLATQKRAATELQETVEQSGIPLNDVNTEFPNLDDLLVALVARQAETLSKPLAALLDEGGAGVGDVRGELLQFSQGLREAYGSVLIGIARVAMTEGSRHREIRKRIYEHGPAAVTATLQRYLQRAGDEGKVALQDRTYEAECLIGMLREPLYRELTLHTQELTPYPTSTDAVEATVDLFLKGCQERKSDVAGN